ncbi:hypothetical protein AB0758_45130 [Tolypothrix bouteillei VB521301_2]|uniref:hypothetical protein n=1 Tax=Tolypothrix bouteillei TaxID=1246981 RepID=UPI0038B60D3E
MGRRSLIALYAFLRGYNVARRELQLPKTEQEQEFEKFPDWIKWKAMIEVNQSWEKIILLYSDDDVKAFEKFFILFEEFVNREDKQKIKTHED